MRKTAVITGASRGIGYELALTLAAAGDRVFAIGRSETDLLKLQSFFSENITPIVADITSEAGRLKILETIDGIKIDYLVNNAAIVTPLKSLEQYSDVEVENIFNTNIIAHIKLTNALVPYFPQGRILNITSVAADCAIPNLSGYCITKAAMNHWTNQLQIELSKFFISVASVIPGEVDTKMQRNLRDAPAEEFPLTTEFQKAANAQTLIPAHVTALFLKWLLKAVPDQDYQTSVPWNIYDAWHRSQWIGEHILPMPLNSEKLGDQQKTRKTLSEFASVLERNHDYFCSQDRHANVLILQGELDFALVKKAFELLYWNHPLLRSTIHFDEEDLQYYLQFHEDFSAIPLALISAMDKNTWRQVLEKKLLEKFPVTHHLWEITIISEGNHRHAILQHFHHAICDGTSTANLQHQVMQVYDTLKNNRAIYLPEDKVFAAPAELFPHPKNSKRIKKTANAFRDAHPLPVGDAFEKEALIESRKTNALLFAFGLEELKTHVITKSKEDNVRYTVNDILVAALLLSKKKLQVESQKETSLLTCINLRKYFQHPLQVHNVDSLFDIMLTSHDINETMTVWEIAQLYKIRLKQTIDEMLQRPVDFDCDGYRMSSEIQRVLEKKTYSGDLATSNIGVTPLQNHYGDLTVEQFNFFTNQCAGFFGILLDVATVGHTVFGNFTYAYPLKSHESVQRLGKIYFDVLQRCIPNFRLLPDYTDLGLLSPRSPILSQLFLRFDESSATNEKKESVNTVDKNKTVAAELLQPTF